MSSFLSFRAVGMRITGDLVLDPIDFSFCDFWVPDLCEICGLRLRADSFLLIDSSSLLERSVFSVTTVLFFVMTFFGMTTD